MKFFVAIILTATLAFIASLRLDWWIIAITSFIAAVLIHQRAWKAFLSGFLGLFLLWTVLAEWIDLENNSLLSGKIGELLGTGHNSFLLVVITGFVGGLVAGFAALSGSYLRKSGHRKPA